MEKLTVARYTFDNIASEDSEIIEKIVFELNSETAFEKQGLFESFAKNTFGIGEEYIIYVNSVLYFLNEKNDFLKKSPIYEEVATLILEKKGVYIDSKKLDKTIFLATCDSFLE